MRKTKDELELANESKNKFFSIISHDLKNPFNAIMGITDSIVSDESLSAEEIRNLIKDINSTAGETFNLLEDLLAWSSRQSSGLNIKKVEIDLKEVFDKNIVMLRQLANNKHISLYHNLEDSFVVNVDRNAINTVIRNLLTNAIKFTPDGGEVKLEVKTQDHGFLLSVTDSGVGIKKEDLEKLFDKGSDKNSIGSGNSKGTGLGLDLCYDFVQLHKGEIKVTSEVDQGTTFTVYIPTTVKVSGEVLTEQKSKKEVDKLNKTWKALLVDDQIINLKTLSLMMKTLDIDHQQANSGAVALEILEKEDFDVVFMDVNMPGMDGIACSELIREKGYDIKIIAATGADQDELKEKAALFDAMLQKPIRKQHVVEALNELE